MYGIHSKQIKNLLARQYFSKGNYDKIKLTNEILQLLPSDYTVKLNPNTNYIYITKNE